uniref:Repeat domain-containing protein n=1 Tax=Candidatus Kentrum sp. LFY TaxID=2126342 RepID=A0A450UC71_9GAMM|nr:MAG: Repeat domain-containing protein [Candidatus Kentron sp. LFY]
MTIFQKQAGRILAILAVIAAYSFARLPTLPSEEQEALSARFGFIASNLPEPPGFDYGTTVRTVSPRLDHISSWISSVGASVALDDMDGDGLPNDICWVDVRIDRVLLAPVPGTGERYPPLVLSTDPLPYDDNSMAPMGCLPGDLDEDGRMDLLVYYWGRTPVAFLQRTDTLQFVPREVYPRQERWFTSAATRADVDGDGHIDLIIGNYFPDGAGVIDPDFISEESMHHSMSRAYNAGVNHLLLWRGATRGNLPDVRFEDAEGAFTHQVKHAWTLAVGAADLDGDQRPEIYLGNDFGPDRLLHNRSEPGSPKFALLEGESSFRTPSSLVLGHDSFKGMGTDFGDVNGDGHLDIYVSNIATQFGLMESHFLWLSTGETHRMKEGHAPYVHGSERLGVARSGWGWGTRLADFDNDSVLEAVQTTGFIKGDVDRWPELQALGTSNDEVLADPRFWPRFQPGDDLSGHEANAFFVRADDGRYYDLAARLGLGEPVVSRGIATADVDGDGDLDFAFANQWAPSVFYRNDCPACGASLVLDLRLPVDVDAFGYTTVWPGSVKKNIAAYPAIGSAATVHLPDGRHLVAQVDGGNGHSGSRAPQLHFGLGDIPPDTPLQVRVDWRDRNGTVHHETHHLTAGWYTVYLAAAKRS